MYISATVPSGIQCVFDPMQNLQSSEEEGSRRFCSFKGKHVPGAFSLHGLFRLIFRLFFHRPFSNTFVPKHSPNGVPKNFKNLKNRQKKTITKI